MDLQFWALIFGALVAVAVVYSAVQKWKYRRYWRLQTLRQIRNKPYVLKSVWGMNRRGTR
ncbi:MAG: hypothetical protein P4N41_23475 [Negativicutes bacterium]|nr:hypothetical protein [Negativicutes bacterium]